MRLKYVFHIWCWERERKSVKGEDVEENKSGVLPLSSLSQFEKFRLSCQPLKFILFRFLYYLAVILTDLGRNSAKITIVCWNNIYAVRWILHCCARRSLNKLSIQIQVDQFIYGIHFVLLIHEQSIHFTRSQQQLNNNNKCERDMLIVSINSALSFWFKFNLCFVNMNLYHSIWWGFRCCLWVRKCLRVKW